jgi:hypothetical protein
MELLFAAAVFGLVLWQMIKTNSTEKLAILIFMGLVLTFPFYVLISSYKRNYNPATSGKSITAVSSTNSVQSTASDIQEDVALAGALKEILEIV